MHQFSCVETLEQNFVVKRKIQHLLNVATTVYFQSRVPVSFWGECLLIGTFVINRTPTEVLKDLSPFEILFTL